MPDLGFREGQDPDRSSRVRRWWCPDADAEATLILLREGESGWWWTKNYDDDDDKRFGNDYDNESFRVFFLFLF